jgi:hypothetical protein
MYAEPAAAWGVLTKQAPPLDVRRGAWWLPEADRDVIIPISPATARVSGGVREPSVFPHRRLSLYSFTLIIAIISLFVKSLFSWLGTGLSI